MFFIYDIDVAGDRSTAEVSGKCDGSKRKSTVLPRLDERILIDSDDELPAISACLNCHGICAVTSPFAFLA